VSFKVNSGDLSQNLTPVFGHTILITGNKNTWLFQNQTDFEKAHITSFLREKA
jgi:hypothetical protein